MELPNHKREHVHISNIRWGDTVEHKGNVCTVGKNDIKRGGFMGTSLFGDTYRLGSIPVVRVIIRK